MVILSGLSFGRQLAREQVLCRGITGMTSREVGGIAALSASTDVNVDYHLKPHIC
jgi:hypothetical protein